MKTKLGKIHPGSVKAKRRHRSPAEIRRKEARAAARRPVVLQMKANRSGKILLTQEDLAGVTVGLLRKMCHDRNIKAGVRVRKQGLIDLLVGTEK